MLLCRGHIFGCRATLLRRSLANLVITRLVEKLQSLTIVKLQSRIFTLQISPCFSKLLCRSHIFGCRATLLRRSLANLVITRSVERRLRPAVVSRL